MLMALNMSLNRILQIRESFECLSLRPFFPFVSNSKLMNQLPSPDPDLVFSIVNQCLATTPDCH